MRNSFLRPQLLLACRWNSGVVILRWPKWWTDVVFGLCRREDGNHGFATGNLLYASAVPVTQTLMVEHGNGVESVDTGQMKVGIRLNGHILQFSFSKPVEERGKAMLFDMNGKLVRSTVLNGHGCFTWNLSGLSSGVYLFKLDGGSWAKKLK